MNKPQKMEVRRVPENYLPQRMNICDACGRHDLAFEPVKHEDQETGDWYQLYEIETNGTPLTPTFQTFNELKKFMLKNMTGNMIWSERAIDNLKPQGVNK